VTDEPAITPLEFNIDRPSDLRKARPWHRLAYIIDALPAGLADLATSLKVPEHGRVLDFGCADQPYRHLVPGSAEYVGADLRGNELASVEISADGTIPVADASFDAVLSTQVLEHVQEPRVYLSECLRALRPGGRLLLSTHGMMIYHPDPDDYWRWTGAGLRRAVEDAGLVVERFEGIMGLGATGLQFVQDSFYWRIPRRLRPVVALILQTAVRIADGMETDESRRMNALVFALVARKP